MADDVTIPQPDPSAPLSGGSFFPPPLPDVDPLPLELLQEPAPVLPPPVQKRQRGRPKRGQAPTDINGGPAAPPPPFVGGPPHDADNASAKAHARAQASQQAELRKLMADPEKAAKMLVGVVDGVLSMFANSRYGHLVGVDGKPLTEIFAVSSKEKDELIDAVCMFMKASSMQLSPGANMAIAFGATYGMRAFALESARSSVAKQRAAQMAGMPNGAS